MAPLRLLLKLTEHGTGHERETLARCPVCDHELTHHQPDTRLPYRILAICDHCGGWFLIDSEAALIVDVPWVDIFRLARPRRGWSQLSLRRGRGRIRQRRRARGE